MILNDIINKITSVLPVKTVIKVERRPSVSHPVVRSYFADKARQALIAAPITPEDEAFNDGVEEAMKRIWS